MPQRVPRGLRPRALRPRGNASRNPRARFFYATEDLEGFTEASIADVRFYCNTSFHSRKVHFKTSDSFVTGLAFDPSQVGNSASFWNSGFTVLESGAVRDRHYKYILLKNIADGCLGG